MQAFFQNLIFGIQLGAIYALIAVGYTMVYGVLRLINFAHGDIYMIGAMTGLYVFTRALTPPAPHETPLLVILLIGFVAVTVVAILNLRRAVSDRLLDNA